MSIDNPTGPTETGANEGDMQGMQADGPSREYADEYPAYLRLIQDIPSAAPFNLSEDELRYMPSGNHETGWQNCLGSVEKYDRDLCQAYREQIDTLLVFAGLFSAVVTAFAIESYQWLQDDPMDTSVELLREMVSLLSQNSSLTAAPVPISAQKLSAAVVVRINSFWFLSLTLSLSAALVGILCKQWLREYERNVGQSPETAIAVRYIRFHGLEYWKVGSIVTSVPIIMQIALALFIIGIIELLWCLHAIVACCVTVTAGLTLIFYLATTFLPVMQYVYICLRCYVKPFRTRQYAFQQAFAEPQCAFKSAQAWLAFRICWPFINYRLKTYGYEFSSHYPRAFRNRILRPADSWVDFDLNWVKCRENIHVGPRCAFEGLTWIAANLGELHMNSWIWHCLWAHWRRNRDSPDDLRLATTDVQSVARSYPRLLSPISDYPALARSHAVIFQCSLRTDIPIDTTIELLLRVTAVAGPCSQWTREALHLVRVVYHDRPIHLSDDIAIALFHLAKLQVRAIIHEAGGPNSTIQRNAALALSDITVILHRGAHLRDIFIPAIAGFVLQCLRSEPARPIAVLAKGVFSDILQCLVYQGYRGAAIRNLRQYRGIMFISKMAGAVLELWPEEPRIYKRDSDEYAIILELLAMLSDGFPELSEDHPDAMMEPIAEPIASGDGEDSNAPAPNDNLGAHGAKETHVDDAPNLLIRAGDIVAPPSQAHRCVDVHVDAETDTEKTEDGVNSTAMSPVQIPDLSQRSPVSPDPSAPRSELES